MNRLKRIEGMFLSALLCCSMGMTAFAEEKTTTVIFTGTGTEEYEVTVPATLAPGAAGNVEAEGTWSTEKKLRVTAPETVTLTCDLDRSTEILDITFDGIYLEGSNIQAVSEEEEIHIADLSKDILFGTWTGNITYNVELSEIHYQDFELTADNYTMAGITREGDVVIPETFEYDGADYKVTAIGERAFEDCSGLTSIVIPEGVTSIGKWAFDGCSSLKSITIPGSVTDMASTAFNNTLWLTSKQAENPLVVVNNILINGKKATGVVTIPEGVTSIGISAFQSCTGLTGIEIPESVTSIGDQAFYGCSGLTKVEIPESVTGIGDMAFYNCSSLTDVTIPDNITSVGSMPFDSTPWLTSKQTENPVVVVKNVLLNGRNATGEVTIPEGVTIIAGNSFMGCSGLTGITIPDSVVSIGFKAFDSCHGLTSVTIPDGMRMIDSMAFNGCTSLRSITWKGVTYTKIPDQYRFNSALRAAGVATSDVWTN